MRKVCLYIFIALFAFACKEKYDAPIVAPNTGYLVVEGIINSGDGPTTITLSRTTKLTTTGIVYEKAAQVRVEGQDGSSVVLPEVAQGKYSISKLNLLPTVKYKLRVKTSAGKEYESDLVAVKNTPPIDSIQWKKERNGLQIYANTHDPSGQARYYWWDYVETWEFHSTYTTTLKYRVVQTPRGENWSVVYRFPTGMPDMSIYTCWQTEQSTKIHIESTAKLAKDSIEYPLIFIPPASWKVSVLYSVIVRQASLTKEAFEFLERMKKNTESTGTIFDPQPSELKGNIRCVTNPTEPVIGYVSICPIREKRIFIRSADILPWGYRPDCAEILVENISDSIVLKASTLMPTNPEELAPGTGAILTFHAAPPVCVDCTLRGVNVKPSFWP